MGFCVANTVNVAVSGWLLPSTVTVRSCMASSNAAWVLAGARLIFADLVLADENRSRAECKLLRAAARQHGDSGDIGRHQIGRELNADEAHGHGEPERADQ